MDTKQLSAWKTKLGAEITALSEKVQRLALDLQKKREQLDLLCKLLESERETGKSSVESVPPNFARDGSKSHELKDHVYEILREANRPMNIKEIHAEFGRRGYAIPGKGTPFNILVHMSREIKQRDGSRFYRTGKGTYALRRNPEQTKSRRISNEAQTVLSPSVSK